MNFLGVSIAAGLTKDVEPFEFVAVFRKGKTTKYVPLSDEERDTLLSAYPDMEEGDAIPAEVFAEIHPEIAERL